MCSNEASCLFSLHYIEMYSGFEIHSNTIVEYTSRGKAPINNIVAFLFHAHNILQLLHYLLDP